MAISTQNQFLTKSIFFLTKNEYQTSETRHFHRIIVFHTCNKFQNILDLFVLLIGWRLF